MKNQNFLQQQSTLQHFLRSKRKNAGMTQIDLSEQMGQYRTFVTKIEKGDRRLDFLEYIQMAEVIGFDPIEGIKELQNSI